MSMDVAGMAGAAGMNAVSGASWGAPPQQKMSNLFDAIDSKGAGSITQSQFNQAFQNMKPPAVFQQQGAGAIFSALDPGGSGSVSKQTFVNTMSGLMVSLRADPPTGQTSAPPSDTLAASLQSLNQVTSTPANGTGSVVNLTA